MRVVGRGRKGLDVIRPVLRVERRGDITWYCAVSEIGFGEYIIASEPIEGYIVAADFVVLSLVIHEHVVVEDTDIPVVGHGDGVILLPVGRELLVEATGGESYRTRRCLEPFEAPRRSRNRHDLLRYLR